MVRMADMSLQEKDLENAYILYMKFMTLFLDKIGSHPEYKTVPAELKKPNVEMLKEVLPKSEKLKVILLETYEKEYNQFLEEQKLERERAEREAKERERQRMKDRDREKTSNNNSILIPGTGNYNFPQPLAPELELLDEVVYPNDFPTDPNKSNLLLPDSDKAKFPQFDRNLKPAQTSFEDDHHLKKVTVPGNTMLKFLQLAQKNTIDNVETCGILAGKFAHFEFIITHIILPKQTGTADSCTAMNEEELFDVQDQHNLITLGWIHV